MSIIIVYLDVFEKLIFWSKQRVLCGISDIFSWQTIWDLFKVFLRTSMSLSHWNHQNTKTHFLIRFLCFYVNSSHILNVFENLIFLSKHESLCGISNIFSRQTIWDLLKIFLRSHIKLWHQKYLNQKTHICLIFGRLYANSRQILNVFENLMFVSKHEPLCGFSDMFSRQTIWDLFKVFFRSPMSLP